MSSDRCRGESGATLVMALIFIITTGALAAGLLSLTSTNLMATSGFIGQRNVEYAADGATAGAVQALRYQHFGYAGATCPTYPKSDGSSPVTIDQVSVIVSCQGKTAPAGQRDVIFTACEATGQSACGAGTGVLTAEVLYYDLMPDNLTARQGYNETIKSWVLKNG